MEHATDTAEDPRRILTYAQVQEAGLADWRFTFGAIAARFETGAFATGLALVDRIGAAAEEADHHPDLVLTYPRVDVRLSSHDVGGVTGRDVALARRISALAADLGATPRPREVAVVEIALDVPDPADVRDFWAAALGYTARGREVVDEAGAGPALWFQDAPEATGEVPQRFHVDIRVAREVAEERVAAVVAAGGTLVGDDEAPAFWVLADRYGNRVCICTADGRE